MTGPTRAELNRWARWVHGYLSALAFLALIFFAGTGLLLDHPDWMQGRAPAERDAQARLTPAELAAARATPDPGRAYADAVRRRTPLLGVYKSAEIEGGEALVHLEGAKGVSDVDLDTASGLARVTLSPASAVNVLGELHRGGKAGPAWRWVIDASAILILLLSVAGYVLFFFLRFRLRTSLLLTGASLLLMLAAFAFLTP